MKLKNESHSSRSAYCGLLYESAASERTLSIMRMVMKRLWPLFDKYIRLRPNELPWCGQQSIVGFLNAAAINAGMLSMCEFPCVQCRDGARTGRGDWWVSHNRREIYIEAEFSNESTSVNAPTWKRVESVLKRAENDFKRYHPNYGKAGKLALALIHPYLPSHAVAEDLREYWCGKEASLPDKCQFAAYYWEKSTKVRPKTVPALFIYGREC